jgi:ABC-type nitrate/sulfonate/bicarbonate transport system ATPase subunit
VSVFSDSQLNCLGMAAFLARTSQQHSPVVLMDDPVPASDEEHQATFSRYVVEALLKQGTQTIITTHDDRLCKQLEALYLHLPLDRFAIVHDDPAKGAVVVKKSDELEAMLATAQPFVRNQNDEIRKHGAARLRDAAERRTDRLIALSSSLSGSRT